MAVIRNTASAMMKGRVGNTTYYVAESRQLARQAMNNSNYGASASRTERQQSRRVTLANLVHFYKFNKEFMKKAFGSLPGGVSVFNEFIKLNLNNGRVALTKDQALTNIWVPEAYQVTKGTLPELTIDGDASEEGLKMWIDNIIVDYPAPASGADTRTIGGLSANIIEKNSWIKAGDMITVAAYFGQTSYIPEDADTPTIPQVRIKQLVIDPTSEEALPAAWNPTLADDNGLPVGDEGNLFVAVLSRNENGRLLVSSARMQDNLSAMQTDYLVDERWFSDIQKQRAIASYGVDGTVLLQPAE